MDQVKRIRLFELHVTALLAHLCARLAGRFSEGDGTPRGFGLDRFGAPCKKPPESLLQPAAENP
jgi:hypothetical protein